MKKFLSVVMAMVLVFSLIPMRAMAENIVDNSIASIEIEDTIAFVATTPQPQEPSSYACYYYWTICKVNLMDGSSYEESGGNFWDGELQFSDTQHIEPWTVGNTYEVTGTIMGHSDTFNVTVVEIERIDVEKLVCIQNSNDDGYQTGDWDYENHCNINQWFEYWVEPENITLYFTDGTFVQGDYNKIQFLAGTATNCYSEQSYENQWGIGEHTATLRIGSVEKDYTVEIVPSPVESIVATPIQFMEHHGGSFLDSQYYYSLYAGLTDVTVTLGDGTVLQNHGSNVIDYQGKMHRISLSLEQGGDAPGYPFQSGQTYEVFVSCMGATCKVPVTVERNPIESIDIQDMSIMEYSSGYDNGFYTSYSNPPTIVTYKDCTTETVYGSVQINDQYYNIETNFFEVQQEEQWTAGNTYQVTGTLLGISDTFNVTIIESPVESIEIEDITIIENYEGHYNGEDFIYSVYSPKATVKLKNGDEREIYGSLHLDHQGYSINTNAWDMQNEELWQVGNTYEVTGTLLGVSDTFNVTIVESPIESLVLEDIVLYEGIDSYSFNGFEKYSFSARLSSVLLKDGTTVDIDPELPGYIEYDGVYYNVSDNSWEMQNEEHWETGSTYEVTGSLLGFRASFNVTIQENPIQEIEILKMPDKTEYLVGEYFNLKGATFLLKYNNGDDERIVIENDFVGYCREAIWSETLNRYTEGDSQLAFDEIGQTCTEVRLFGKTCEIPVTVKENLIESVTIKENPDKSITATVNNSDDTSYDMTLLDICIWWGIEGDNTYVTTFTDKGVYDMAIYDREGSFAIGLGDIDTENVIKSNSISNNDWYETIISAENFCAVILPGNDNYLSFSGDVTADNIDRIIGTAFYMDYFYSWDDEDVVWEGDYATIRGERIRESIAKYFALENVDLTLSESYDAQSDTYELFDYIRLGWMKTRPMEIEYNNGVWSIKVSYLSDDGTEMNTYLKLNDEQKIISYRVNTTEIVDDVDMAGTWKQNSAGWWYEYTDGTYPANCWEKIDNQWYYFNASGYRVTGWLLLDNDYYYLDANGVRVTNRWVGNYYLKDTGIMAKNEIVDGIYVGTGGEKFTGWLLKPEGYYYYQEGVKVTGWILEGSTWYYMDPETGVMLANEWLNDTYYMTAGGGMATGWLYLDGVYCYFNTGGAKVTNRWVGNYYLDEEGHMATNAWVDNGRYYVDASGAYVSNSGWFCLNGEYYYLSGGLKQTGWILEGSTWYYMDPETGVMLANEWLNDTYYMTASGAMATGWVYLDGIWYYLNAGGLKQTGWILEGSTWYYMDPETGVMLANEWLNDTYYMTASGAMATGWVLVDETWYYMSASGAKVTNQWIGNCYVGADGAWVQ